MADLKLTSKKTQIDKAQAMSVSIVAAAVFVAVFSLVSTKSLWTQRGYQSRVIAKKQIAKKQLEDNVTSVKDLVQSYQQFVGATTNIMGGNPTGTGEKDGDNARLILDALPSKYDFPALTTSLEKLISDKGLKIESITGTDDEVNQSAAKSEATPAPVAIPFQITVSGSYAAVQDVLSSMERSIRPFQSQKLLLKSGTGTITLTLDSQTYFMPQKSLDIKQEEVK